METKNLSRKNFLYVAALASAGLLAGCSNTGEKDEPSAPAANEEPAAEEPSYPYDFVTKLRKSEELYAAASQTPGTVESMTYTCHSYALEAIEGRSDIMVDKTLYVYLPNGYDPSKQYDILYLMHGTGDKEGYWLTTDGNNKGTSTLNLLDSMHDQGLCEDTIVVTPTYYSIPEGMDINISMSGGGDGGLPEDSDPYADEWPMYFWQEIRNDIVPLVEAKYSTYAGGDVSEEAIIASRDHRAFAGLSRGSMTTVNSAMMHCLDYFAWIGCYSGVWADFDEFKSILEGEFADYDVKYWYNGNGTDDFALENHQEFVTRALEEMPDRFKDGENYSFVLFEGGVHAYNAWIVDLYNSLLCFFKS